jgi:hypothetical protein
MRATTNAGFFVLVLAAGAIACGGRTLLDDPSDELPLGNHESDAGPTPGSENDASGGQGGSSSGSGTGSSSGSGSGSSSGSSSGGSGTVACGAVTCKSATQDCCATMTGAMSGAASCVAKGACMGVVAMCTSAASCSGGEVCCGSLGGAGGAPTTGTGAGGAGGIGGFNISVKCEKTCGTGGFQLCDGDAECGKGVTCQSTPFGAKLCGGLGSFGGLTGGATGGFPGATGH